MIPLAPWLPDSADFANVSSEALNVIPSSYGFRPFPGFTNTASAITARAQGAISVRSISGTIFNFCGDATKLYKLATNGLSWSDVSRVSGGVYATAADSKWSFAQYGDYLMATNGNDDVQVFQLGVSTNFAALGGTPPDAYFAGAIREFGVLAKTSTENNRVRWSAIGDIADWVASATTLSDYQDLPDGGSIMGFVGGEFGIIFQERAITRMSFEGPPTAFRFDKIASFLGCRADGSIAAFENFAFFLGDDGMYMIRGGSEIVPIGVEKVDRWIEENIDASFLHRVTSAIDPVNKLYVMGFPSINATTPGTPDQVAIYHWPTGQWSHAAVDHQMIYAAATQATYTIDGMDAAAATIDGLPFPMDSRFWAGSGRLLLSAFDTSNRQGYFSAANLAATIETGDTQLTPGGRSLLKGLRPIVEGSSVTPSLTVGKRNYLNESITYGSPIPVNAYGICNARVNGRYHRARITIPAASLWTFARGVDDLNFSAVGRR
jgi:hypothetical protein